MKRNSFFALTLVILAARLVHAQGTDGKDFISPTVIVTLGKPNVWTLEQAHYLLEKNRAHDLGISAADVGALDANEVVGFRIDAIKSLFNAQVQFDQSLGAKNRAGARQFEIDSARFNDLRRQQDELRSRQAAVAEQLATAQFQVDILEPQSTANPSDLSLKNELVKAQANVKKLTSEKAALDAYSTSLSSATSSAPNLNVSSTLPQDTSTATALGQNATFDKILGNIPAGLTQSRLGASIRLDNYINMQYEIVAKQLTLLRDEAGPNNLVLFVELPQSIYATQKFKPYPDIAALWGHHLVQTWWRIDSIQIAKAQAFSDTDNHIERADEIPPPDTAQLKTIAYLAQHCSNSVLKSHFLISGEPSPKPNPKQEPTQPQNEKEKPDCPNSDSTADLATWAKTSPRGASLLATTDLGNATAWMQQWDYQKINLDSQETSVQGLRLRNDSEQATDLSYALDLIPRQSALNVAEAHSVSRAYGFAGLFGLLSGLGFKARYERQHDQYDQFLQQEVFASAFGKGERQFGWTFGPLPGTKRLAPGLRTTYAVIVVPKGTRTFELTGYGCAFRRRTVPDNPFAFDGGKSRSDDCRQKSTFVVEVPSAKESFWVRNVYYRPVSAGQRTTVEIQGDFTPQVGVLVNGSPLQRVVSLGDPLLERAAFNVPPNAGEGGVQGVFEAVGKKTLLLSFTMPATYVGTPRIALISPTKAMVINGFKVRVNGVAQKLESADPIFIKPTTITRVAPEYCSAGCSPATEMVKLQIFGSRLKPSAGENEPSLLVNGKPLALQAGSPPLGSYSIINDGLIQAVVKRDEVFPHWHIDYFVHDPNGDQVSFSRDDDGPIRTISCKLVEPKKAEKDKPQLVHALLTGDFLNSAFTPTGNKNLSLTATSYEDSKRSWDIQGTVSNLASDATIGFKGTNSQLSLCACAEIEQITSVCGGSTVKSKTKTKTVIAKQKKSPTR